MDQARQRRGRADAAGVHQPSRSDGRGPTSRRLVLRCSAIRVGCLIARRGCSQTDLPWFAGDPASVQGRIHRLAPQEAGFEDGTSLPTSRRWRSASAIDRVGIDTVRTRVSP
jgi:hypothetical protein